MNITIKRRSTLSLLALLCLTGAVAAFAADETAPLKVDSAEDKPKPKTEEPTEKPKERSLLEKLGDELLREVDDTPGAKPEQVDEKVDKMDRAVKGMRTAGTKLEDGLTAGETQAVQKQVIKDLEDIINQLENPPPPNPNGGGGGGGGGGSGGGGGTTGRGGRRGGRGSSMRMRSPQHAGGSAGQQPQGAAPSGEAAGAQIGANGTDSSKMTQAQKQAAEEAARRRKLEMDIWGHLPAHLREELLSTYGDRMLPKYEQMVKQFYEVLSVQGDSKKSEPQKK